MSQEVAKNEELVRGVFSSREANRAKRQHPLSYKIFLEGVGVERISVDRFSLTTPENAAAVAREVARNRGENRRFYGWLKLTVRQAEENNRRVSASPIEGNPYHADIILPGGDNGIEYVEQAEHAQELARLSHWQPPPD